LTKVDLCAKWLHHDWNCARDGRLLSIVDNRAAGNRARTDSIISMKLLLLNPNVTTAVTDTMAAEARRCASPGTEIVAATAHFGASYVENRIEAAIASHAVLEALAEHTQGCDAAIVAAFGDPGLYAAKEMLAIPVVGISEAAFLTAYQLGRRYSIVCLTERLRIWYMECAQEHGLARRLVSARAAGIAPTDIGRSKDETLAALLEQCRRAIEDDGTEAIVLGGGPIAGIARSLAAHLSVPIVDGVSCAVRLAEGLIALRLRKATHGSFARPGPKPTLGLAGHLQQTLGSSV
jgi:Asp/Glu/hydantoin racemase